MIPAFHIHNTELQSTPIAITGSAKFNLIAVGYNSDNHQLIETYNADSLELESQLAASYIECVAIGFDDHRNRVYFLARSSDGDLDLCHCNSQLENMEKVTHFDSNVTIRDLKVYGEIGALLLTTDQSIEVWDLDSHTCQTHLAFNDDNKRLALIIPSQKLLAVFGAVEKTLTIFSLNSETPETHFTVKTPFEQCEKMLLSANEDELLLVKPGIKGAQLYETKNFSKIYASRFNQESLNFNYLFSARKNHILRLGKSKISVLDLIKDKITQGPRYEPSITLNSSVTHHNSNAFFSFSNSKNTLFRVHIVIPKR